MKKSIIWDDESEDRKDYLIDKFMEDFFIKSSMTEERILEILESYNKLSINLITDDKAKQLAFYLKGEKNKKEMFEDIVDRIKNSFQAKIKNIVKEKKIKFKKGDKYEKQKSRTKIYGTVKGKTVKVKIEKYLIKGKIKFRIRDNKGHYATLN